MKIIACTNTDSHYPRFLVDILGDPSDLRKMADRLDKMPRMTFTEVAK